MTESAAQRTGFSAGTAVYTGIGDAGATTLASGVERAGRTTSISAPRTRIAQFAPEPFTDKPGAADLAFGVEEGFVNAVPFLNAGDVHKWVTGVFSDGDYAEAHQLIETSKPGSNGVLCLPYLVGGAIPIMNPNIRGAYGPRSRHRQGEPLMRAALEGVAFSIRQGMERFDAKPTEISLIGGGAEEMRGCPDSGRCVGASLYGVRQCRYSASSGNGLVGIQCTRPAAISMRMHCIPAES